MNNDLISREALKEAFKAWKTMDDYYHNTDCKDIPLSEAFDLIDNAPTVERPQGEWIEDSGNIVCSHCHTIWLYFRTDFCPNCGADMRGGRE